MAVSSDRPPMAQELAPGEGRGRGYVRHLEGQFHSIVPGKDFCFVRGDDGQSYFLRRNEVRDPAQRPRLCMGAVVSFEPHPRPKGLVAKDVQVADPADLLLRDPGGFIIARDAPERGTVIHACGNLEASTRDGRDDAKSLLAYKASPRACA